MSILKQAIFPIGKMIMYNDYAITAISIIGSFGFVSYMKYFDIIIKDTDMKNLILPVVIEVVGCLIFFIFSLIHTTTGLQAAKYEYKRDNKVNIAKMVDWFDSDKIWKMYWKTLGVVFFTLMIMLITMLTEITGDKYLYITMLWLHVTLLFLACGFEFQSIGNNLTRIGKEKYNIFLLVDKIISIVQTNFTSKLKINNNKENNQEDGDR